MADLADTILERSNRWMQAWVAKDSAVLEDSLAPDFALVVSATPLARLDRAAWLATATTRYTASTFRYRDVQVRDLGGGMAVISAIAEFRAEIDGLARNGPLFVTDVWRLGEDGRWQVCARYSAHPELASPSAAAVQGLHEG